MGGGEFDRLLEDTRRVLEQMRSVGGEAPDGTAPDGAGPDGAGPDGAEQLRGQGEAVDGQVRAVAVSGGRLESLTVDPRAMRLGSAALCEHIVAAVNAALDDLRDRAAGQPVAGGADPAALAGQLRDLHGESVRQMDRFSQGIADVLDRISRSTGR